MSPSTSRSNRPTRRTNRPRCERRGPEGEGAIVDLLKVDDSATRIGCLLFIGKQKGDPPASLVPSLSAALGDKSEDVRGLAAHLLGLVGPAAKDALPGMVKLLSDPDERVREVAQKAIKKIEEK